MRSLDIEALLATAHALADAAREAILPLFRTPLSIESKSDAFDPVTLADRRAEEAMRAILAAERPEDGILGEEGGAIGGSSGLTWVLDPIDGTRAFISGTPTWGVLIGLRDSEQVLHGIIDQPFTGERFEGGFGTAEWTHSSGTRPLAVRKTTNLEDATILTTFPEVGTDAEGAAFRKLSEKCRLTRYGLDCYAYALLAAGHVDLVVEAGLHPYDICAPIGVIEAAGGVVTSWQGEPALDGGAALAAATPELHRAAMDVLNG
ncbi:histidinol-phosphatase [Jannaschia aquimarina]|uniref:Histidinol-phosphatase n=1 Tax=Jannaschia aquimarina TaxID=935700 RepID=A0A0D1EKE2_9RHOB|nr:histidinol-phosphatase [Jannaschia aquimarina]KIT17491.1 Histidinol-phosphatase [Jannaschia aquimarina]SNS74670.1 histidinol-phosphatase, inositol monophosphatase family [Jannaschia aquimarina]